MKMLCNIIFGIDKMMFCQLSSHPWTVNTTENYSKKQTCYGDVFFVDIYRPSRTGQRCSARMSDEYGFDSCGAFERWLKDELDNGWRGVSFVQYGRAMIIP